MALLGYARVSTADQNLDRQIDALTAAGCDRIFTEKASGKLAERPELTELLAYMREGDTVVVTKLDRLGRSLANLIELANLLQGRGVGLRVTEQGIDTTSAAGRMFFHVVGAIAEFERELIVERTNDGLAAARARGRVGGRPRALTPTKLATARRLYDERELTVQQIADVVGCSRATLYRELGKDEKTETARSTR